MPIFTNSAAAPARATLILRQGGFRRRCSRLIRRRIIKEVRGFSGRRVNLQSPEESLLLQKPTGRLSHGGGLRLRPGSDEYRTIKKWIESGMPYVPEKEGRVLAVRVEPTQFVAKVDAKPTPLKVIARLHDGKEQDVTHLAKFEPFDATIAEVDDAGKVTAHRSGDIHILAHYAGQIGYAFALVPQTLPKGIVFVRNTPTRSTSLLRN